MLLLSAAYIALDAGRIADGIFLYWAGRTRYAIDAQVFTTDGRGIKTTALALQVMRKKWFATFLDNPDAIDEALSLFRQWDPEVVDGYLPSWPTFIEHTVEDHDEIQRIINKSKSDSNSALESFSKLVRVPEYVESFKVVLAHEASSDEEQQEEENVAAVEAAKATMTRIEGSMGIGATDDGNASDD